MPPAHDHANQHDDDDDRDDCSYSDVHGLLRAPLDAAICDSPLAAFGGFDKVGEPEQAQHQGSELRRGAKRQTATLAPEQLSSFVQDADRDDVDELDFGEVNDDISDGPFDHRGHRVDQQLRSRCVYITLEGENCRRYSWAVRGFECALRATSVAPLPKIDVPAMDRPGQSRWLPHAANPTECGPTPQMGHRLPNLWR